MSRLELKLPPLALLMIAMAAMWGLRLLLPGLGAARGTGAIALAVGLAGLGGAIGLFALAAFHERGTTVNPMTPDAASALVTGGIYRLSRNPMYLGLSVLLVAFAAFLASPVTLAVVPLFVAYLDRFQIAPEERAMRARFGAEFDAYAARVRRWL